MPFVIGSARKGARVLGAALGLALLTAGSAQAAGAVPVPVPVPVSSCTPEPSLTQPFSAWNDLATYTPAPGGDMESDAAGWTLTGDADVVSGNESYYVGGRDDKSSLELREGSSATTPPLCIDETYPFYRLFARNTGDPRSTLKEEVLYLDAKGNVVASAPTNYLQRSSAWSPTTAAAINVFTPTTTGTALPVSFRFTPIGKGGRWQIDDVYVDPYARR